MQIGTALCVLHVRWNRMVIYLISDKAIALSLSRILWGEFLSDFHQFNTCASLLLVKRSSSGGFSSYRLHNSLSVRVAYESFSCVVIGWATLSSSVCLLCGLLMCSVLGWAIEGFDSLRCWSSVCSTTIIVGLAASSIVIIVVGWVWLGEMVTSRNILRRTGGSRVDSRSLTWTISCWGKYSWLSQF